MKTNVGLLLKKRAEISPVREAFVEYERDRRFSFALLNERANRIANALLAQGTAPGDRVATLLKNGIEFVETYFALAKIGAIMVPVNWRLVAAEITYILSDSGALALVYDSDFDATVSLIRERAQGEVGVGLSSRRRHLPGHVITMRSPAWLTTQSPRSAHGTTTCCSSCTRQAPPVIPRA